MQNTIAHYMISNGAIHKYRTNPNSIIAANHASTTHHQKAKMRPNNPSHQDRGRLLATNSHRQPLFNAINQPTTTTSLTSLAITSREEQPATMRNSDLQPQAVTQGQHLLLHIFILLEFNN